jgi:hypothetical protein
VKPAAIAAGTGSDCTEGIPAAAAAKRVMSLVDDSSPPAAAQIGATLLSALPGAMRTLRVYLHPSLRKESALSVRSGW